MTAAWTMPRDMSRFSTLEAAMLRAIHAAGLIEPRPEWPFDWCCPHEKGVHRELNSKIIACFACQELAWGFGRQAHLHEYRRGRAWRFDFAWPEYMLAVECEGGTYSGGRHTRGDGFERDADKYNAASLAGWAVLRFTGDRIESGAAIEVIEVALRQRMEAADA